MATQVVPLLYDKENARPLYPGSSLDKLLNKAAREIGAGIYTLIYHDVLEAIFTEDELAKIEDYPGYKANSVGKFLLGAKEVPSDFKDFIRADIEHDPESDGFEYVLI